MADSPGTNVIEVGVADTGWEGFTNVVDFPKNSFIAHVNILVRNLRLLLELNRKFPLDVIKRLLRLLEILEALLDHLDLWVAYQLYVADGYEGTYEEWIAMFTVKTVVCLQAEFDEWQSNDKLLRRTYYIITDND